LPEKTLNSRSANENARVSGIEIVAVLAAGAAAGMVNTIVGSGSLITFPTLLALGYAPVTANVSNTVGLLPGSISGTVGYRRELGGQGRRALPLAIAALLGGITGALLLLVLPASAFSRIVPFLILIACALMVLQPRLSSVMARPGGHERHVPLILAVGVYLNGIYGGYFGAAQGVILIALLGILLPDDLQRLNALKNLLTIVVNGVAALLFVFLAPVAGPSALVLAIGAVAGGQAGALVGRRLPQGILRGVIVVVGTVVAVRLLIG
jgi:uncharacterized membrane protein YfcA